MKVKANSLSLTRPAVLWCCRARRLMWMSHSICCKNEAPQDVLRMEGKALGILIKVKLTDPKWYISMDLGFCYLDLFPQICSQEYYGH